MNFDHIQKIYFVGIGGIGMSALARYFNGIGKEVHGYDKTETGLTRKLVEEGMTIHYDENVEAIPSGVDLVVYTPAVPDSHAELQYFRTHDFPLKKRAEVLGIISRNRKCIGVAGTHGKTTTSSLLTYLLRSGGLDCSAFLGGVARNFASNFVEGQSEWVVVEADEYDRSFLHLRPEMAIVLSMDADHLDIYGDVAKIHEGFNQYVSGVAEGGSIIHKVGLPLVVPDKRQAMTFGFEKGDLRAENIRVVNGYFEFDLKSPFGDIDQIKMSLPGHHNIENALAAIGIAQQLKIDSEAIKKALASFKGIKRRFEIVYRDEQVVYIDDYAHHPSELKAAIHAARTLFPKRKITGIFQPHLYSRTQDFADGFAEALDQLDKAFLLDIYPARELPIPGVSSEMILKKMKNPDKQLIQKDAFPDAMKYIQPDVLLTMGAGNIDTLVEPIKTFLSS
ncbi:MAG: UDP-N-acetylmuramate--L-alanine ligase [Bacteroidota bacterium]